MNSAKQTRKEAPSISDNAITSIDVANPVNATNCYNTKNALVLYSTNKFIAGTLTVCPTALYAPGADMSGQNYWTQKEFSGSNKTLTLTFNEDISSDFHLSEIYNELESNGAVGKIEQINTSDCDTKIAAGNTKGQSCNIDFMYTGLLTNTEPNTIHLIFTSSEQPDNYLDFKFEVRNQLATIQNIPILNSLDSNNADFSIYMNSISDNGYDLTYSTQYNQSLTNRGSNPIIAALNNPNSDLIINTGSKFITATQLGFVLPRDITSCGSAPMVNGMTCLFPFNSLFQTKVSDISTQYARFVYTYQINESPVENSIYSRTVAMGVGDIIPSDYIIDNTESPIQLVKQDYGNDYVVYAIPMDNLKLTAEYNPELNLPSVVESGNEYLRYAFGDYGNKSIQSLLNDIKLEYDPNCFNSSAIEDATKLTHTCEVKVDIPQYIKDSEKPIGFQLYANYDSSTGEHIKELIGTITTSSINSASEKK